MRNEAGLDFGKKIIMVFTSRSEQSCFGIPASEAILSIIGIAILMLPSGIKQLLKKIPSIFSASFFVIINPYSPNCLRRCWLYRFHDPLNVTLDPKVNYIFPT